MMRLREGEEDGKEKEEKMDTGSNVGSVQRGLLAIPERQLGGMGINYVMANLHGLTRADPGDVKAIEFDAELKTVRTLTNGDIQVTLELPDYCIGQAMAMMLHRLDLVRVVMEFVKSGR